MHLKRIVRAGGSLLIVGLVAGMLATGAQAKLTGEFVKFTNCPYKNAEVRKCIYAVTESGEVVLGNKTVPITKPVTLQGGYGAPTEEFSKFYEATNGVDSLSKTPQNVPGGLAGLVNCKEISNFFLRISCEVTFENGLTGVNSTLELAKPASEIRISENHLAGKKGIALELPLRVHLENPFLGSGCFIGSSSSPVIWKLTTGTTEPPPPNEPISGAGGKAEFKEGLRVLVLNGAKLVDNSWSAPGATGCGGFLVELLLNPIINASVGVPSAAGNNTAILNNTISQSAATAVLKNDESNP
jgi:hypothetical protein